MDRLSGLLENLLNGSITRLLFEVLVTCEGQELATYGSLELRDGPAMTKPRLATLPDGRVGIAFDLWFMAGMLDSTRALAVRDVDQPSDTFWRPAGRYRWELHSVVSLNPETR